MTRIRALLGACALSVAVSPCAFAGDLTLTMRNGRVTLIATNVPLRQILAEWAKVGQTKIVGADRLSGPALTLELRDVPERQALETLLRSASGYLVAPRADLVASASLYDRILILPTSSAPAAAAPGPAGRAAPPRPMAPPTPVATGEDQEIPTEPADDDTEEPDENTVEEDAPAAAPAPVFNPYPGGNQPAETNFDYANPQLMLQRRQQMLQEAAPAAPGAATPGTVMPGTITPAPTTFPGTVIPQQQQPPQATPQSTLGAAAGTTTSRPGEIVNVPQPGQVANPYGLPPGVQPGSAVGPPMEPDRSKYMNPYQPRPPQQPPQ